MIKIADKNINTIISKFYQILSLPAVNIYQEDPESGAHNFFRKGKSCLFALPNLILEKPLHTFPVTLSVYKKLPAGVLPDVMHIGAHQIEIKELMNGLLREHVFRSSDASKSLKNNFTIETATGQVVGNVTVFIRASCFGKKLVTQFEIPHNRKPYLFKSLDDSNVFECERISTSAVSPGFSGKKSTTRDNIDP
ncbi:microtubule-associated protein 10, partial [Cotesia typhae]|uniref:microtubule-associated protein 10 n=1 Tax=Cotesia typhae TaxID=2053667 RepID=UPI003D69CC8A